MIIKSTNCHMKITWNTTHCKWCNLTTLCNHRLNQLKFSTSCLGSSVYTCSYMTCN